MILPAAYSFVGLLTLTGVKRLEKIVPEQIQPASPDQIVAGETHDFAHFFTMARSEAMNLAVLASRLFLQRAPQATFEGVKQEFTAFMTCGEPGERQSAELGFCGLYDRFAARMVGFAVNRGELQQDPEVLEFLPGKWLRLR